jgi:hypothetical protein
MVDERKTQYWTMTIRKPAVENRWARDGDIISFPLKDFRPHIKEMPERGSINDTVINGTSNEDAIN